GGDTVSLSLAAGTPTWVSLTAPAGNPANASFDINPPATVPEGTYGFNVDGVDSNLTVPMFASENVLVHVTNARPGTTMASSPAAVSSSGTPSFTFSSDDPNATFQCQLDGGSWTTCSSPVSYVGVGDGRHTFKVRAVDVAGQPDASPESYSWTVDSA